MASLRQQQPWRAASDPSFLLFLVTVVLCLPRARDLPSVDVALGGTTASVTPADLALALLAVAVAMRLLRGGRLPRESRWLLAAAAAFGLWLFVSSLGNGASAAVASGKLVELGVLTIATVVFVDTRERFRVLVMLVVLLALVTVAWAVVGFVEHPGNRQASFVGEHDLAALSTMSLVIGLVALYARSDGFGRLPLLAGMAGAVGIVLGAPLASLVGLYLAAGAIVLLAAIRGQATRRSVALTLIVLASVTAGTYEQRSGELGFLRAWFAPEQNAAPGTYAASWSQRLLFAYIGARIFLDHPAVGTGWYGLLPPAEYARYLPGAHRRFSDQPARYFPSADGVYTPQQTYDQVLYELGLVGATLFVALGALAVSTAVRAAKTWPRGDPDESMPMLTLGWLASLIGVLAGAALFGGTPIAMLFWLTLGTVAAVPALSPRPLAHPVDHAYPELATMR